MVSVRPNTIAQSISDQYVIVLYPLTERAMIKWYLADMRIHWVLHEIHFTTTQIRPGFYIYTLERSFCLMINIMIDIRHISRCVIQIFKSVRFILHVPSLDYIFSSVHVKNLSPTAHQEDVCPRCRSERLPLNIHASVMTTYKVSPFRVAQNAALTLLLYIYTKCHIMSYLYSLCLNKIILS